MFTRIAVCLLLSLSLTAQDSDWQHYFYANYLLGVAETNETLWFATPNSILQLDENEDQSKLHYFNNAPVARQILDFYQEGPETFIVLSGFNEISRWHAGKWSHEVLQTPTNTSLRRIIGQGKDGTYYVGDYTTIFKWDEQEGVSLVPEIITTGFAATQGAKIDGNGWMWLWRYNRLLVFNENFEVMIDQTQTNNYINDLVVDKSNNNVWLINSNTLEVWLADEQNWETFTYDNFDFNSTSKIISAENNEVLLGNQDQFYKLSYAPASGLVAERLYTSSDEVTVPLYFARADSEGSVWFFNGYGGKLTSWKQQEGIKTLRDSPWIPVSDLMSFGIDQQGKIWTAGVGQPAYLMGGRWHTLPPLADSIYFQAGARDIVFTDQGYPVVGTGTLFSFGFPNSELMAWNGMNWDTIKGEDFGSQFLLIRELELDENNNFWVMRSDDDIFSIKSQGEWYHYKTNDMPIDVDRFTCLEGGREGQMWIGTNKGVISYDGFKYIAYDSTTINLGDGEVRDIAVDEEGNVWLSLNQAGIRKWDGEEWTVALAAIDLPLNVGTGLLAPDGKGGLWVTLDGEGIMHFDGQEWELFNTQNSGLADNYINNIIVDGQGRLWCAAYQSISVYTPEKRFLEPFKLSLEQEMVISPNPGCCQFIVNWEAKQLGTYDFCLFNNLGQEVQRWSKIANDEGEQFFIFNEYDLSSGTYFLQVVTDNKLIASQPLIITY